MAHIGRHRNEEICDVFSCLPDECIYQILSNVNITDLICLSPTCRRFRRLCLDSKLWKQHFNNTLRSLYPAHLAYKKYSRKASMDNLLTATAPLHKDFFSTKHLQQELNKITSIPNKNSKLLSKHSTNIWNVIEDDSTLVWGVRQPLQTKSVLYGSLDCLVKVLTCVEEIDLQFVKAFLMTFESFTSIELLFVKLMQRYFVPENTKHQYQTTREWRKKLVLPVRFRVINILKLLIEKHVERVCENRWMMERFILLIIVTLPAHNLPKLAQDLSKLLRKKIKDYVKGKEQVQELEELAPVPNSFRWNFFDDSTIAAQLTALDHLNYRAIKSSELLGRGWVHKDKSNRSPNVIQILSRFNMLSNWVTQEILHFHTFQERGRAIERFISIAKHLLDLNNFQSMTAIISGLNGYPILRLKRSWTAVTPESRASFHSMEEIMDPTYSYRNYRQKLYTVEPPCVPFMGITFMDLDFLEGGRNWKDLISFSRHHRIYEVISLALMYQSPSYNIAIQGKLHSFLHHLTQDSDYEQLVTLSLELEPRE